MVDGPKVVEASTSQTLKGFLESLYVDFGGKYEVSTYPN